MSNIILPAFVSDGATIVQKMLITEFVLRLFKFKGATVRTCHQLRERPECRFQRFDPFFFASKKCIYEF